MQKDFKESRTLKQEIFKKQNFSKAISAQQYDKLSKDKGKWTDDLFSPSDASIYSGKTDFSKGVDVPSFLSVFNILIFKLNNSNLPKLSLPPRQI
jgi:hypothetical protein